MSRKSDAGPLRQRAGVNEEGTGEAASSSSSLVDELTSHDLDVARNLIRAGVRIFAAKPATDAAGTWDSTGGTGQCGYWLPGNWQATHPTENWLDPSVIGFENRAWRPGWALCAVMGGPFDALDVDPRNGGEASRSELDGAWPQAYAEAETPSGGTHELVAALGVASRDNVRPGIDVKAGTPDGSGRGFVFIAPTRKISKTTGEIGRYRWRRVDVDKLDPGDTSGEKLAGLVRQSRNGTTPTDDSDPFEDEHAGRIPAGGRDKELFEYAASLRGRNLPIHEALVLIEARWAECEQPAGNEYPLGDAVAKVDAAYRQYRPNGATEPLSSPTGAPGRFRPLDWKEVLSGERAEPDWLCEPLIERGTSVAIYSTPKAGKSILLQEIGAALATGRAVLGNPARPAERVLYLDQENTTTDIGDRLTDMGYSAGDFGDRFVYLSFAALQPLDTPAGAAELHAVVDEYQPALIVLDTVSRYVAGDENEAATFANLYRLALAPLKARGIAVVRLDHAGKDTTKGQRGTSAKSADVDAVWALSTDRTGTRVDLSRDVTRNGHGAGRLALRRGGTPLAHSLPQADPFGVDSSKEVEEVIADLDRLGVPNDAGRPKASEALASAICGRRNDLVAEAVKARKGRQELSRDHGDRCPVDNSLTTVPDLSPAQDVSAGQTCPGQFGDRSGTGASLVQDGTVPLSLSIERGQVRTADADSQDDQDLSAVCRSCGGPLLLRRPGREHCEKCRLAEVAS